MAHALVAVDERGSWGALQHADARPRVDRAALELAHITCKAKDAMRIRAGEIGFEHRGGGDSGIGLR